MVEKGDGVFEDAIADLDTPAFVMDVVAHSGGVRQSRSQICWECSHTSQ